MEVNKDMKKILTILIIMLLIICSFGVRSFSIQITDVKSQITLRNSFRFMIFDGRIRTYQLHIPPSYDGTEPIPVVIALHGHTGGWPEIKFGAKNKP